MKLDKKFGENGKNFVKFCFLRNIRFRENHNIFAKTVTIFSKI
jgi:hypothetical protein